MSIIHTYTRNADGEGENELTYFHSVETETETENSLDDMHGPVWVSLRTDDIVAESSLIWLNGEHCKCLALHPS